MVLIFGAGFVGLTTALGFAHHGIKTYIFDVDKKRIEALKKGQVLFEEPQLEEVLEATLNKTLYPVDKDELREGINASKYMFSCVGTPEGENGSADLSQVYSVIDSVAKFEMDNESKKHFIVKSSVPPGTLSKDISPYINNNYPELSSRMTVSVNPEFLREGHCWEDFIEADRVILGCNDGKAFEALEELYSFTNAPIIKVNSDTAEFIKYESNALLATMISYSNEMSIIARKLGNIDIKASFEALHLDKRWGDCNMKTYVYPGCGYGGYCLPKDVKALCSQAKRFGYDAKLLSAVDDINENILQDLYDNMVQFIGKDSKIGILGLSFKPKSDDVRQSPSAKLIKKLIEDGYTNIYAHDPVAIKEFVDKYELEIFYQKELPELYNQVDVIVLMTAWEDYRDVLKEFSGKVFDFRYYTK